MGLACRKLIGKWWDSFVKHTFLGWFAGRVQFSKYTCQGDVFEIFPNLYDGDLDAETRVDYLVLLALPP